MAPFLKFEATGVFQSVFFGLANSEQLGYR